MTGPACGNNPNHKLSDGDRQAVVDFKAYLAARAALRDRIAAALYERERPPREPAWPDAYPADREVFEAMADAVVPVVLPAAPAAPHETAAAVLAVMEAALGDTLVPAARAEALAGIAAVLPATTNHDTDTSAPLSETERKMLDYALDLADEEVATDGSDFTDDEEDALAELRRIVTKPIATGTFELRGDDEIRAAVLREVEAALSERAKRLTGEYDDSDILHEDGPAATVATWKRAAELVRRVADETAATETQPADLSTLAAALDGFATLLATSSRDWGVYRVDAWLYAVICGWDCEKTDHDETCVHGAMEEMQELHGWDDATVAKARRYRAAVRALVEKHQPAAETQPDACPPGCVACATDESHDPAPATGAGQDGAQR